MSLWYNAEGCYQQEQLLRVNTSLRVRGNLVDKVGKRQTGKEGLFPGVQSPLALDSLFYHFFCSVYQKSSLCDRPYL